MSLQRWYTLKVLLSQKKKPQIHKKVTFKRNEEQGIYVLSNCCPFKNENTGCSKRSPESRMRTRQGRKSGATEVFLCLLFRH